MKRVLVDLGVEWCKSKLGFVVEERKMGSYQLIREKKDARLRWDPQQGDVIVEGEGKNLSLSPRIEVITSDATSNNNDNDLELSFQKSPTSPLSTLPKSSGDHGGPHFRKCKSGGSARLLSLDIFRGITVAVISHMIQF